MVAWPWRRAAVVAKAPTLNHCAYLCGNFVARKLKGAPGKLVLQATIPIQAWLFRGMGTR